MPLTSYSELKAALAAWNTHPDIPTLADDLIDLAEARFNLEIRTREMRTRVTGTVSGQTLSLPTGFLEVVQFSLTTSPPVVLTYTPPHDFYTLEAANLTGKPRVYTILGDTFYLAPTPDGSYGYALDYVKRLTPLSSSDASNWLLAAAPNVYLFACLAESERVLQSPDRAALWDAEYLKARAALELTDWRAKSKGSMPAIRVA